MTNRLDKELLTLNSEVIQMGAMCETAVLLATKSLLENDLDSAKKVIAIELETNKKERDIEDLCLKVLLRQQPVAKDLRNISATLKMITDMERIADQARDIAEIAMLMDFTPLKKSIELIGVATLKMVTDSIDCYASHDISACHYVIEYDNVVDDLFDDIQKEVVTLVSADTSKTLEGMYLLMISKYFERIGDHSTNIAEWVEFMVTGKHKGDDIVWYIA